MNEYLRKATIDDMDLLFEWANEELVRKNSFSTKMITYEEHVSWYEQIMFRKDVAQYIYMNDDIPIGQVRVNIFDDIGEVGFSVCTLKRGQGHGTKILELLYEKIKVDYPDIKKLIGKVKPENTASQKAFLNVGYEEIYKTYQINMDCNFKSENSNFMQ